MSTACRKDKEYIDHAFELAYFIHGNRGTALCVACEAWCKLEHALGRQDKRRYTRPRGLRRKEYAARPLRTKIPLREEHLLQCLVYDESERWERCGEHGDGPVLLTEEDMIIRFIKHLILITVTRNSFYVTLGIGRLLHNYTTTEAINMYDVLIQDEKRSKESAFWRQRKVVLMNQLRQRFHDLIHTITTSQREERFQAQPTTPRLVSLVQECLRRFTPWQTDHVVPEPLNPADRIPAFAFAKPDPDEEAPIETNRIHAILDPECLARLTRGLGLDAPEERLTVPQFFLPRSDDRRGDRFHPPKLREEDYQQVLHTREERVRWRKVFRAQRLRIYVNHIERASFDPRQTGSVHLNIGPDAYVIEVRGEDARGELVLMTLFVRYDEIPLGESLCDWVVLEGGQKVTIQFMSVTDAGGGLEGARVEVKYAETTPLRALALWAQRTWFRLHEGEGVSEGFKPGYAWLGKAVGAIALVLAVVVFIRLQWQTPPEPPEPPHVKLPPPPEVEPVSPTPSPLPPVRPPFQEESSRLIAQATWSVNAEEALNAISIETVRSGNATIDFSGRETTVVINLPVDNKAGRLYSRYRVTLPLAKQRVWRQTLRAPKVDPDHLAHVMKVTLFPQHLPVQKSYELRVEGQAGDQWESLGHLQVRSPAFRR